MLRAAIGVRGGLAVAREQVAVKFRLDLHMAGELVRLCAVDVRVADGIQTVVAQNPVEVGDRPLARLEADAAAYPPEEFQPGLRVVFLPQRAGTGGKNGVIIEKRVRPVQPYVVQPAEARYGAAGLRRHGGEQRNAKPVVCIIRRHKIASLRHILYHTHFSAVCLEAK